MRDYIAYEIQAQQQAIAELQEQEDAKRNAEQKRRKIIETSSPSAVYLFLKRDNGTEHVNTDAFRAEWHKWQKTFPKDSKVPANLYEDYLAPARIDLTTLPSYSFVFQFKFTLSQPYISKDEQDFYIIDNPVRKDKVFGFPYVASTSWKGSLRAALWKLEAKENHPHIIHLFGARKKPEDQQDLQAGCLYFFPTFFDKMGLEVINPQNRTTRAGENPIPIETVPPSAIGTFTLLYVPFDLVGKDDKTICKQVAEELQLLARGLEAMFRLYGFGAKTSSGFGLAQENIIGTLQLRMRENAIQETTKTAIAAAPPTLPAYLETPNRLKSEYLTEEGMFRERSEMELKNIKRSEMQKYDKAKKWWEREGKHYMEKSEQPTQVAKGMPSTPTTTPINWPKWEFSSFEQLSKSVEVAANKLMEMEGQQA